MTIARNNPPVKYPHGTYTKIARRLGITPTTVRQVALGLSTSKRVEKALARVRERLVVDEQQQVA